MEGSPRNRYGFRLREIPGHPAGGGGVRAVCAPAVVRTRPGMDLA